MSRTLLPAFTTHLNGQILFLANMALVTRRDGEQFGFTSHDRDLTYDSVTYEAFSSLDATEVRQSAGGGVDNLQIVGLLKSDRITDTDLRAGLYDGAEVQLFQVNWADLTMGRMLVLTGTIGEITHRTGEYTAEVRSLSQRLAQQIVELTSPTCRVRALGDARCLPPEDPTPSFDLDDFQETLPVEAAASQREITFSGDHNPSGWYDYGRVRFITGANANLEREIKSHVAAVTPVDPLTLPGLELYLRSDQVTGADGSTVTSWPDLSGNGRTANLTGYVGATGPTLRITGANISPNGEQMVQFGGATSNGLRTASFSLNGTTNGLTVYAYYKQIALTDRPQALFSALAGTGWEIPARGDTGSGYAEGKHGFRVSAGIKSFNESATTGYHLLSATFALPVSSASGFVNMWRDGVALTPTHDTWTVNHSSNYHIGNDSGLSGCLDGSYGALLIFSRTHDTDTRLGVEAFLDDFFETLPGSHLSATVTLQEAFPFVILPGDTALLEAGCDRTPLTCRTKFSNLVNFQGEPHIPGVDQIQERGRR